MSRAITQAFIVFFGSNNHWASFGLLKIVLLALSRALFLRQFILIQLFKQLDRPQRQLIEIDSVYVLFQRTGKKSNTCFCQSLSRGCWYAGYITTEWVVL